MSESRDVQLGVMTNELRMAAERMGPTEQALGDALLDLAHEVATACELLALLADETAIDFDPGHSRIAGEAARILLTAGYRAVGEHAAVVGELLEAVVH